MARTVGRPPPPATPLYDPVFEHDACGIGFVADAGGRSRDRVLGLALAGLGALGHRGAFAADGESSDGAGVSLPLEPALLERLAPGLGGDAPAVLQLFLPRGRVRGARARGLVVEALASAGLSVERWREVPFDAGALGASAAAEMPALVQAIVLRPVELGEESFERRLILARRRLEAAARAAGVDELSVPSASAQTIVYKGLVAGGRLAQLYPDLAAPVPLRYALFHQRYATNTHPVWRLAQPFRSIAHNGEINTVRGNVNWMNARRRTLESPLLGADLDKMWPLIPHGQSDTACLDNALELLIAGGYSLAHSMMLLIPEAWAGHAEMEPKRRAFYEYYAALMEPWDGPAAVSFTDGNLVGATLDRNGLRPGRYWITED
ncbi:MAG: glutamate synthase subunit alpha, partial [Chloroflexota bacterium]|nr:glutamate synthase subunit alpha [Chloroflexota bacterium]